MKKKILHSIFLFPASAKQISPVESERASEFGSVTSGELNNKTRSLPSRFDISIFGDARFQSDQYNLLKKSSIN